MASIWDSCIEYAQDANGNPINDSTHAIFTLNCVPYLIDRLLQVALVFGGAIAVFFIVWGGFKIVRSAGDPKQMEGARNTIVYAIIGLIIVFLAYFIIAFIADVTGVQCLKTFSFDECNK